ncbi:MAG: hypothetical protein ACE5OZ_19880 [Candidatus Heimdallarchaeota archaeon]
MSNKFCSLILATSSLAGLDSYLSPFQQQIVTSPIELISRESRGIMLSESEGSLERLRRAEQLMQQGRVDEAQPFIEILADADDLTAGDRLTWQLLKGQLSLFTGDYNTSYQLAEQV